ncbi:hypothetical protein AB1283_04310 [Bacillus sp. S13(2024)]|uniref:hypothetical protein n=1 Tax=unclassified Bacillus (in: firmicutes) TaxID=185979 RepID=UPI003D1B08A8
MTKVIEDVKRVFVYDTIEEWGITKNEEEAKQIDSTYKLATVEDLHTLVAFCGHIFKDKLLTADGVVEWHEKWESDELSGIEEAYDESEYKLVN